MPLSTFLKSAAGTCPFCNQKAGILSREHPDCRRTFQVGWNEMVNHAAQAAALHTFDEKTLRLSKAEIARRSCRDGKTVSQAADEGCGPLHCQQPPVIGRWYTILPPQRSNFSANLQMHVVTGASLRGRTPTRRHASGGVRKNELHSQMFTNRPTEARGEHGTHKQTYSQRAQRDARWVCSSRNRDVF